MENKVTNNHKNQVEIEMITGKIVSLQNFGAIF